MDLFAFLKKKKKKNAMIYLDVSSLVTSLVTLYFIFFCFK